MQLEFWNYWSVIMMCKLSSQCLSLKYWWFYAWVILPNAGLCIPLVTCAGHFPGKHSDFHPATWEADALVKDQLHLFLSLLNRVPPAAGKFADVWIQTGPLSLFRPSLMRFLTRGGSPLRVCDHSQLRESKKAFWVMAKSRFYTLWVFSHILYSF